MPKFASPLDNMFIAAPCSAGWDEMNGDDQIRHCFECQLNVYNLSAMTRREAEKLLVERDGRLCVRFYQRLDGTIITQNCPRGIAAIRRRVARTATAVFSAVISFLAGIGVFSAVSVKIKKQMRQGAIEITVDNKLGPHSSETVISNRYFEALGGLAVNSQGEKQQINQPPRKPHVLKSVKRTNKNR